VSLTRSMIKQCQDLAVLAILVSALGLLNGCATTGGLANPKDPMEGFNRAMFAFNDGVDKAVIKPVAEAYVTILPSPLRLGVVNFFGNIADVFIAVNNLLQGKLPEALGDVGRVAINTTVGLLGVIDIASDAGLEKHDEDFGQTFGRWGVAAGPYVVLPIFGPRTMRDAFAQILDSKTDPVADLNRIPTRNSLIATRIVSDRADFLSADKIIDEAALDRYAYVRDAYLQRRRSMIYDGNAPREVDEDAQFDLGLKVVVLQQRGTDAGFAAPAQEPPQPLVPPVAPVAKTERQEMVAVSDSQH